MKHLPGYLNLVEPRAALGTIAPWQSCLASLQSRRCAQRYLLALNSRVGVHKKSTVLASIFIDGLLVWEVLLFLRGGEELGNARDHFFQRRLG